MSSVNKVIIIGNLGNDPETRSMNDGTKVTNLSVATSETWKDKQSGEKCEKTEWHKIVIFGRLAEIAAEYLSKGSKVYIEGQNETNKWQDKDGNDRYTTQVKAREMRMLSPKGEGQRNQQAQSSQQPQNPPPSKDFDDDIPF